MERRGLGWTRCLPGGSGKSHIFREETLRGTRLFSTHPLAEGWYSVGSGLCCRIILLPPPNPVQQGNAVELVLWADAATPLIWPTVFRRDVGKEEVPLPVVSRSCPSDAGLRLPWQTDRAVRHTTRGVSPFGDPLRSHNLIFNPFPACKFFSVWNVATVNNIPYRYFGNFLTNKFLRCQRFPRMSGKRVLGGGEK